MIRGTDTQSSSEEKEDLSQGTYTPTPYSDASWEVIGQIEDVHEFMPMSIEVLPSQSVTQPDPMFADYGGLTGAEVVKRWHLPKEMGGYVPEEEEESAPEVPMVSIEEGEFQQRLEEARQQGIEEGRILAQQESEEKLNQLKARVTQLLQEIQDQFAHDMQIVERQAVSLAVSLAEKVIANAVDINPEYIVPILHDALSLTGGAKVIKIKVSPEDHEFISVLGIQSSIKGFDGSWHFESDESIKSGCVVETSAGEVDYNLEKAWERVKNEVVKVIR